MNLTQSVLGILGFLLGLACAAAITYRQRWKAIGRVRKAELCTSSDDQALADWTRNTKITVNTVTGSWVTMTLAQVAKSSSPTRSWNVPTSVRLHPKTEVWGEVDEDQAKEHRG